MDSHIHLASARQRPYPTREESSGKHTYGRRRHDNMHIDRKAHDVFFQKENTNMFLNKAHKFSVELLPAASRGYMHTALQL